MRLSLLFEPEEKILQKLNTLDLFNVSEIKRPKGGGMEIRGFVPLSEMFGYATDLRSRTQGRGNYSMFFEKYEPVPKSVQEKVLAKKD